MQPSPINEALNSIEDFKATQVPEAIWVAELVQLCLAEQVDPGSVLHVVSRLEIHPADFESRETLLQYHEAQLALVVLLTVRRAQPKPARIRAGELIVAVTLHLVLALGFAVIVALAISH